MSTADNLSRQLEELHLLKCSLLPGESLTFASSEDAETWGDLLDAYAEDSDGIVTGLVKSLPPARFAVQVQDADVWFDVELPTAYRTDQQGTFVLPQVSVKGMYLSRSEQARWQAVVHEALEDVRNSEYPLYDLISTSLLPRLHDELDRLSSTDAVATVSAFSSADVHPEDSDSTPCHALLTSHHLVAPSKRRALRAWASELTLVGFAKLGYPGVLYSAGTRGAVTEFVRRVKGLQWLALRVRFVEPLPAADGEETDGECWVEFEKVGEVVGEMRRLGRERFVVEMGIGSAGTQPIVLPSAQLDSGPDF